MGVFLDTIYFFRRGWFIVIVRKKIMKIWSFRDWFEIWFWQLICITAFEHRNSRILQILFINKEVYFKSGFNWDLKLWTLSIGKLNIWIRYTKLHQKSKRDLSILCAIDLEIWLYCARIEKSNVLIITNKRSYKLLYYLNFQYEKNY